MLPVKDTSSKNIKNKTKSFKTGRKITFPFVGDQIRFKTCPSQYQETCIFLECSFCLFAQQMTEESTKNANKEENS